MKKYFLTLLAGILLLVIMSCEITTGPSVKPPEKEIKYNIIIGGIINGKEDSVTVDLTEAYKGEVVTCGLKSDVFSPFSSENMRKYYNIVQKRETYCKNQHSIRKKIFQEMIEK